MSRFLVAPEDIQGNRVTLRREEAHHLVHVLRFREGDCVVVFDGSGNEYRCVVQSLGKKECQLGVLEKMAPRIAPAAEVALAHCVTRGERFDWVVEKGTELGVLAILPFSCERMAVSLDAKTSEKKVARWQKLAQAASKQCGRADIPQVSSIVTIEKLIPRFSQHDLVLLAYELEEKRTLKAVLRRELEERAGKTKRILAVVGPEGGFSVAEVEKMTDAGAQSVSLGQNILRTETAAIAMLAMIFYELMP